MQVSERKEIWGHGLEFVGLLAVLLSALWHAGFSGWWEDQLHEWQAQIQEDVNLSLLYSAANLAALQTEQDPALRAELTRKITAGTAKSVQEAIDQRDKRRQEMESGQAALFLSINTWLLVAGASLFAIGKWFTLTAALSRAAKDGQR